MIDRKLFLDSSGKPLTQSLFLELHYTPQAVYTLKEIDHEYNGKIYPSIKRLYLEEEDPTEYNFASKHFLGWKHWARLSETRVLRPYVREWRDELEYKLRSKAVKQIMDSALGGSFQAAKWFMDRGWVNRAPGRPSKEELEREKRIQENLKDEYSADVIRLQTKG